MGRNGYVERFGIPCIPAYFGKHRAISVCSSCRGGALRLFGHYGNYACRFWPRTQYLSQKQKTASRKRLSAAKLRLNLGGSPDIREPMPSKPKWTRRRTYQRIRNESLEAKASQTRFRKQIDIRTFAYLRLSSCAVIEFPRIEPFLALDQGNQQLLIRIAFGSPSEARDLLGSP